jgi:Outer membrane protein beta-barrel domain
MNRYAVALSLALMMFGPAQAQSSLASQIAGDQAATEKLHFSLKFGLSCGTLTGFKSEPERLGGINFGLAATIRLSDRLAIVPEVTPASRRGIANIPFVTTGNPELDPYFEEPAKSALVLEYVDVPVLVKYRMGRFSLGAGPFFGFLTSATERFRAELETGEELLHRRDVVDQYESLNFGLVFEASYVVMRPRRGEELVFHIRYQAGLADILKDPSASSPVQTLGLQVFVSFPFIR